MKKIVNDDCKEWADQEHLRGKFVLHKCCIKKCTVNKMVFLTCCTANLDFVFHGCRLVEGFVAVRRFRGAL